MCGRNKTHSEICADSLIFAWQPILNIYKDVILTIVRGKTRDTSIRYIARPYTSRLTMCFRKDLKVVSPQSGDPTVYLRLITRRKLKHFHVCALQALEEEFARKLQEQEVFFKMSGESECLNPSTQTRISKFYPIPSVQSTGF